MSASLVGSEMCIRDRSLRGPTVRVTGRWVSEGQVGERPLRGPPERARVAYNNIMKTKNAS
eukprot:7078010-Alexandrium_andersonii.AAC.1